MFSTCPSICTCARACVRIRESGPRLSPTGLFSNSLVSVLKCTIIIKTYEVIYQRRQPRICLGSWTVEARIWISVIPYQFQQ